MDWRTKMKQNHSSPPSRQTSYIHLRSNSQIYYYRIVIPSDLRHFFGIVEFRRSLHTPYRRDARQMALRITSQIQYIFILLRKVKGENMDALNNLLEKVQIARLEYDIATAKSGMDTSPLLDEIEQWKPSVEDLHNLMNYIFTRELEHLNNLPIVAMNDPDGEAQYKHQLNDVIDATKTALKEKNLDAIAGILISEYLLKHGVTPSLEEDEAHKLALGGGRSFINFAMAQLARLDGDYLFEKEHLAYDVDKLPETFRGKAKLEHQSLHNANGSSQTPIPANKATTSTDTAPLVNTPQPLPADNCPTLSEAFDRYIKHSQSLGRFDGKQSVKSAKSKIRLFIEYFNDIRLSEITRQHVTTYLKVMRITPSNRYTSGRFKHRPLKDILGEMKPLEDTDNGKIDGDNVIKTMRPPTMNNNFSMLKNICGWAIDEGYLTQNPFNNMRVRDKKLERDHRSPFTRQHLKEIFFSEKFMTDDFTHPYEFWTPVIALFSGMRSSEISQLRKTDIIYEDNVWCFNLTEEDPNPPKDKNYRKSLKNKVSKRKIPIHPFLLDELNFLEFWKSVPITKYNVLFTGITPVGGKWGKYASRSFNNYVSDTLGYDSTLRFHSFRHTVKDFYRQTESYNSVCAAFLGHSPKNESAVEQRYGSDYLPSVMKKKVDELDYGIDLSHLATSKYVIK